MVPISSVGRGTWESGWQNPGDTADIVTRTYRSEVGPIERREGKTGKEKEKKRGKGKEKKGKKGKGDKRSEKRKEEKKKKRGRRRENFECFFVLTFFS